MLVWVERAVGEACCGILSVMINRTKIVCTIGPASKSQEVLEKMILAGMDVARINFSHGSYDSNLDLLDKVRAAASRVGRYVAGRWLGFN